MSELVKVFGRNIFCDSRMVAEKFNKQHHHVMQKIDKLLKDINILDSENLLSKNCSTLVFNQKTWEYKGQTFKYFEMNRSAFTILAMGFTGKKALQWKLNFEKAFSDMEKELLKQNNLEWNKSREQGKTIRLALTDEIKDLVEHATIQGSKNAKMYYANITKMQYKALGFIEKNEKLSKEFRNTLDVMELNQLLSAEMAARKAIREGLKQELHYKDIYQLAKKNVMELAKILVIGI